MSSKLYELGAITSPVNGDLFYVSATDGSYEGKLPLSTLVTFLGFVTPTSTSTLTNKRITPRVVSAAYAATVTPNSDTTDVLNIGTLTGNLTLANPTGTPTDGQKLILRFTQDATGGRTITRGNAYALAVTTGYTSSDVPSSANAAWEEIAIYHAGTSKWRIVGFSGVF